MGAYFLLLAASIMLVPHVCYQGVAANRTVARHHQIVHIDDIPVFCFIYNQTISDTKAKKNSYRVIFLTALP